MISPSNNTSLSHRNASDIAVNGLHGSAPAEVVRKAVDGVAPPHAALRGSGSKAPATLPNGECGVFEGQGPSSPSNNLDILASNVTPPKKKPGHFKSLRHKMRRKAGAILPTERVATCGSKTLGGAVTLHSASTGTHYGGLTTCGSVWHCPVCAAKIGEKRREEVETILNAHHAAGGNAYMMTLTIPHHKGQNCKELLNLVRRSMRQIRQGAPWYRAIAKAGYLGDVRALEVTHGDNGWHPHLHVLIMFKPGTPDLKAQEFGHWVFDRWASKIEGAGYGSCSANAFTFDKASQDTGAADYVGKWGVAAEITRSHIKSGKSGRTPWQLLSDATSGDKRAGWLFNEYGRAYKGARQLTWTRKLREHYAPEEELSDQEAAKEESPRETLSGAFHPTLWKSIYRKSLTATLLNVMDEGGFAAVETVLKDHNIPFYVTYYVTSPHKPRGVPMALPIGTPAPTDMFTPISASGAPPDTPKRILSAKRYRKSKFRAAD